MKPLFYQIHLNVKRMIYRNPKFFFLNLLLPILFYFLFTQVMVHSMPTSMLKEWHKDYLISMIIYSTLLSSIMTLSATLYDDKKQQFDKFITLSPVSKSRYFFTILIVFFCLTFISTLAIALSGQLINHVSLSLKTWLSLLVFIPITSIPLMLIGVITSFATTNNMVNLLNSLTVFPLAIISGLWWPFEMMPNWLQTIGELLPPFQTKVMLISISHDMPVSYHPFILLIIWTLFLITIIFSFNTYTRLRR